LDDAFKAKKTPAHRRGLYVINDDYCLVPNHISGLGALGAVFYVKRNRLSFSEDLEAFSLDSGEVNKHVLATVFRRNKTKTFGFVEPLNCSCSHLEYTFEIALKNLINRISQKIQKTGITVVVLLRKSVELATNL
jgi:hypothetical protein